MQVEQLIHFLIKNASATPGILSVHIFRAVSVRSEMHDIGAASGESVVRLMILRDDIATYACFGNCSSIYNCKVGFSWHIVSIFLTQKP